MVDLKWNVVRLLCENYTRTARCVLVFIALFVLQFYWFTIVCYFSK